jgi:Na+-transporting methylmalonyl-CoA/oxaloacetate decarboxylase gamma subunit
MNPETLALGVQTTVVGLGVVFFVLAALWFLTLLLDQVVESASKPSLAPAAAPAPAAPTVATPVLAPAAATGLSPQTVAAIMGAVSAFSGAPLEALKFTAIRRASGMHTGWSQSSVNEIIQTRQQFL